MGNWNALGPALRSLRVAKGLTQDEVARRMGVASGSAASRIESDDANPRWENVARYLEAIGSTPHDVVAALSRLAYADSQGAASEVREAPQDPLDEKVDEVIGSLREMVAIVKARERKP